LTISFSSVRSDTAPWCSFSRLTTPIVRTTSATGGPCANQYVNLPQLRDDLLRRVSRFVGILQVHHQAQSHTSGRTTFQGADLWMPEGRSCFVWARDARETAAYLSLRLPWVAAFLGFFCEI
jgi:hypothetical protein